MLTNMIKNFFSPEAKVEPLNEREKIQRKFNSLFNKSKKRILNDKNKTPPITIDDIQESIKRQTNFQDCQPNDNIKYAMVFSSSKNQNTDLLPNSHLVTKEQSSKNENENSAYNNSSTNESQKDQNGSNVCLYISRVQSLSSFQLSSKYSNSLSRECNGFDKQTLQISKENKCNELKQPYILSNIRHSSDENTCYFGISSDKEIEVMNGSEIIENKNILDKTDIDITGNNSTPDIILPEQMLKAFNVTSIGEDFFLPELFSQTENDLLQIDQVFDYSQIDDILQLYQMEDNSLIDINENELKECLKSESNREKIISKSNENLAFLNPSFLEEDSPKCQLLISLEEERLLNQIKQLNEYNSELTNRLESIVALIVNEGNDVENYVTNVQNEFSIQTNLLIKYNYQLNEERMKNFILQELFILYENDCKINIKDLVWTIQKLKGQIKGLQKK